jgi:hypothetical protein
MTERDDNPDAPPSAEEIAASQRLREALDDDRVVDADADLARSLRAAYAPDPLSAVDHAALVSGVPSADEITAAAGIERDALFVALRAAFCPKDLSAEEHRAIIARALGTTVASGPARPKTNVIRIAFTSSALAIAAAIALYLSAPPKEAPMARSRSTQPLFSEPFKAGETSARIDKIALARASDYRDNRFAKWGVR